MKKWQRVSIWALWIIALIIAFDLTDYFIEHGLVSQLYVGIIEGMFLLLGAATHYLPTKKSKKK